LGQGQCAGHRPLHGVGQDHRRFIQVSSLNLTLLLISICLP
jgi:hypothetical protein